MTDDQRQRVALARRQLYEAVEQMRLVDQFVDVAIAIEYTMQALHYMQSIRDNEATR